MSDKNNPFPLRFFINPLYWPTWLGLGVLWLTTRLPYRMILLLGALLGTLSLLLLSERRRIARTNINLCFPELGNRERHRLLRRSFYNSGMALFESALAWWGDEKKLRPLMHIEGLENLKQAEEKGNGVIMLGAHYTTIEMGGRIMSTHVDNFTPTYKRARNKAFELVMAWSRKRIHNDLIKSMDMRDVVRTLKNRKIIWYAPDQDYGMRSSVFAPFMGVPAATLTMASRLSKLTGAPVLPWYAERLPGSQGYKLTIAPALKNFPSGDDVRDTTQVNDAITAHVRHVPEQYLWGHRRFKTRPVGEPPVYRPRRDRPMFKYTLLLSVLAIPAIVYCIVVAIKFKNIKFFTGRLGLASYEKNVDFWIHAASVGEINAVAPLISLIRQNKPSARILLTTNTPTGYQNALKKFDHVTIQFLPFDWRWASIRFINRVNPVCPLIFETELWPNLYEYAYWKGKRITLINGRLSARSVKTTNWSRFMLCKCIQYTHTILARSEFDRDNFLNLCAAEYKLRVIGNIKWASTTTVKTEPATLAKPYILLASTRDDEEKLLCESLAGFLQEKNYIVTIIPRHPKRLTKILASLEPLKLNIAVRSKGEAATTGTQIYIADTFGEMDSFIAGAELVIMGGSFVSFGGQNIIEVARHGKAVVFGPHMNNFLDEARCFIDKQAGIQIELNTLTQTIKSLLGDKTRCSEMGNNGLQLVAQNSDMAQRYYDEIMRLCGPYTH